MNEQNFVNWIKEEMTRRGFNSSQLAIASGLSKSTVSMVLRGERGAGIEFINGIARAFKLDPSEVARRAGLMNFYVTQSQLISNEDETFFELMMTIKQLKKQEQTWLLEYVKLRIKLQ